jgi:hypothetical protein
VGVRVGVATVPPLGASDEDAAGDDEVLAGGLTADPLGEELMDDGLTGGGV